MSDRDLFAQAIKQAMRAAPVILPPASLSGQVLAVIAKKRRFYALVAVIMYAVLASISCAGFIFVLVREWGNIVNSEALKLLSLLFSDFAVISQYWQEYAWSVLESMPITSILFVAVLFWLTSALVWMTTRAYAIFTSRVINNT